MGNLEVTHDADGGLRVTFTIPADELDAARQEPNSVAANVDFQVPQPPEQVTTQAEQAPAAAEPGGTTATPTGDEGTAAPPPPTPFGEPAPSTEPVEGPQRPVPDPDTLEGRPGPGQ